MTTRPTKTFRIPGLVVCLLATIAAATTLHGTEAAESMWPKEGEKAPDFELPGLDGKPVSLAALTKKGDVVLLVLRGYPGYQCPICRRQIGDFAAVADKIAAAGASVVLVYPGDDDELTARAKEFFPEKLPDNFYPLVDAGYKFTNAYGLRWDAPRETAYPATFVIDADNQVQFVLVSMTHGGRTKAADVLKKLPTQK